MRYFLIYTALIVLIAVFLGCESDPYTEVERHIIAKLKIKMHDPNSLEVIDITNMFYLDYEHFERLPRDFKIMVLLMKPKDPKENFKVYTIDYRGKNSFGALRLNKIYAIAGTESITGLFCHFFTESDLIKDSIKKK